MSLIRNSIASLFLVFLSILAPEIGEATVYSSQSKQVSLIELYVSEGCSSCPPAQKWVSQFINDTKLWNEIVPVVFHVNYWDYLGWKDPFASKAFTERQYDYKHNGQIGSVYTPGFVVNGQEWRGWFQGRALPVSQNSPGILTAHLESDQIHVRYDGDSQTELNIAILGVGIDVNVTAGENRNRTLREDFVVLAHTHYGPNNGQWNVPMPEYKSENAQKYAIAFWVNQKRNHAPIQATGGWLR